MCETIVDIQAATAKNRRRKTEQRKKKNEETTAVKYNGLLILLRMSGHRA